MLPWVGPFFMVGGVHNPRYWWGPLQNHHNWLETTFQVLFDILVITSLLLAIYSDAFLTLLHTVNKGVGKVLLQTRHFL